MSATALVLAAGLAGRFGGDKRRSLLPSGQRLLDATIALYRDALGECTVVIDRVDTRLYDTLSAPGVCIATVAGARSGVRGAGMGDSLAAGIACIAEQGHGACLIALGDMPGVRGATVRQIAQALGEHGIVVPSWRGQWGHPVGFDARYFTALSELRGDTGARGLLRRHAGERYELPVEDAGVLLDVDVPGDLQHFGAG